MEFRTILLRMEVSGIKNIEVPVVFDFVSVATNRKKINLKNSNVKAIFAENGAGKSALMNAIDIYKKVVLNYAFFSTKAEKKSVYQLINKDSGTLNIKMYFAACVDEEVNKIYEHDLTIKAEKRGRDVLLTDESISEFSKRSLNSEKETIIEFKNGELLHAKSCDNDILLNYLLDTIKASFGMSSIESFLRNPNNAKEVLNMFKKYGDINDSNRLGCELLYTIINVSVFGSSLSIYLADEDIHTLYDTEDLQNLYEKTLREWNLINLGNLVGDDMIHKSQLQEYKRKNAKLIEFIKIFKTDLVDIEIKTDVDNDYYHIRRIFNYGSCAVDYEYESSGIKKLVKIFDHLYSAANGGIAFVDEMDANINDIYLERMVEYFVKFGKGQLVFTTHNTSPMRVLKKKKHGIDFINTRQEVISWITNGNYAPESQYRGGMIRDLPFNVEAFDFIRCFDMEE